MDCVQIKTYFFLGFAKGSNNEILAHSFFNDTVASNNSDNEFRKTLSEMVELVKEKTKGYHEYNWQWKDDSTRIEKKYRI